MVQNRKLTAFLILVGMLNCIGGCAVGPDYAAPKIQLPDQWQSDLKCDGGDKTERLSCDSSSSSDWRVLNDDVLMTLIDRAIENNKDLKISWFNLQQARAQLGVIKGEFYPTVSLDGSYTRARVSKYGLAAPAPVTNPNSGRVTYPDPNSYNLYSIGGMFGWEIDLFGKIRRSYESILASEQAAFEAYHDVMVILKADVASNYINVRTLQERLRIAGENIESQRKTLDLVKARYDSGLVPALDVSQAVANLTATEASVPSILAELRRTTNYLDVLLGELPGSVAAELIGEGALPTTDATVAIGLPCDVVRRRPDIRRAERELAAQSALIGVATADLYPSFSLIGSLHLEATTFSNLGDSYGGAYSFGPQFNWNVFQGNRIRSQIKVEQASTEAALVNYEQTVLRGLLEVEDAANDYLREIERRTKVGESVVALEESVKLVEEQYRNGLTDFQNVLDMQRSLFLAQDNLAESRGFTMLNLVRIIRATGGGWNPEVASSQPAASTQPVASQPSCKVDDSEIGLK